MSAYLGGRFVLGSGRTWPHDFRFLAVFFSGPGDGDGVDTPSSCLTLGSDEGIWSSVKDLGVIISIGFMVEVALGVVTSNSDVKLSPGIDIRDSAGECWNLSDGNVCWYSMFGVLCLV